MWTRPCLTTILGIVSNELHFLTALEQHCAICFRINSGSLIIFTSMLKFLLKQWINCLELNFTTPLFCPFAFFFALNILHIEVAFSTLMTSSILMLHFLRQCYISYFDARCIFYLDDTFYLDVTFSTLMLHFLPF